MCYYMCMNKTDTKRDFKNKFWRLNLFIKPEVIEAAKIKAIKEGISLSEMVENLLEKHSK